MRSLRQMGAGFLLSFVSVVIVLGGLSLSLAESGTIGLSNSTPEALTNYPTLPLSYTNTPDPNSVLLTSTPFTPPPTLVNCPPPANWLPTIVQPDDTLISLAQTYNTTTDELRSHNCLLNDALIANSILYVPPLPTMTAQPCNVRADWGNYPVMAGDTLYRIGLLYRISWQELMQANCLGSSYIKAGQILKVPNVPTSTAIYLPATETSIPTAVDTLESTPTPDLSTPTEEQPTITHTVSPSETAPATDIPSETVAPSEPSETPIPVETATPNA